jgi:putative tricarboxylic transport membrane protein
MNVDVIQNVLPGLAAGIEVAFTPSNLVYAFLGALVGTAIGVLPGLGSPATIALLLPATYGMDPASAVILLAAVFQGAMYGGSTTSILLRIPGESASVMTCLDGHAMAREGRAGVALAIAAVSSFAAASIGLVLMTLVAPLMARFALGFGPPEYTALVAVGLIAAAGLSAGSPAKGLLMVAAGLLLGTVGIDPVFGEPRFTFGIARLMDGFDFVVVGMGLFGVAEVLGHVGRREVPRVDRAAVGTLRPTREDWHRARGAILRGSGLGFVVGTLPGGGAVVSSFLAYALEQRVSSRPEAFGTGAVEGVAAPEAANNAASVSSFIPLLTLGVPGNAAVAMIFVALMVHGVQPGPFLIEERPDLFWGVIASMYAGNLLLVALNLPLIAVWVRLLRVPYPYVASLVLVLCMAGAYSIRNAAFDVGVMTAFGVLGLLLRRGGYPAAPLVLAMILGRILERSFVQSLQMSAGDLTIFVERPLSAGLLLVAAGLVATPLLTGLRRRVGAGRWRRP